MDFLPLRIEKQALNNMIADLESAYPDEGCGFLYGQDGQERVITEAVKVVNSKEGDKRRRFEIGPLDYIKGERYADENNLKLLGVYHSHPNHPARPSVHDLNQAFPYFSYIIVSVNEGTAGDITSWQLDEKGEFQEEKILDTQRASVDAVDETSKSKN